jgi:hypothetical protein
MATERVIDLEHSRYCDRPYEGALPESTAVADQARSEQQHRALQRLRAIASDRRNDKRAVTGAQLRDLLLVLGLDE